MPPLEYIIRDDLGALAESSATAPHTMLVTTVGKDTTGKPYLLFNELVCAGLGRLLGLPIAQGVAAKFDSREYFVSLKFTESTPPPIIPTDAWQQARYLCTGTVLFDAWICNNDRHNKNLAFDSGTQTFALFDHSHSLFHGSGVGHLHGNATVPGIDGHCLVGEFRDEGDVGEWLDRFRQVPAFQIRDVVREASRYGVSTQEREDCIAFLDDRRSKLGSLFAGQTGAFPHVNVAGWANL
jgi:hypothetical protein